MSRRALVWASAAVVAAAVAAAVVVALVPGRAPEVPPPRGGMIIASSIPRAALFGDTLDGRVDIVVDRRRIDPASIEVTPTPGNWLVVAPPGVERTDSGATTHLVYRFSYRCLVSACLPPDPSNRGRVLVPVAPVRIAFVGSDGRRVKRLARWPRVEAASRVSPRDLVRLSPTSQLPYHATIAVPAPTYRISPTLLTWLLACGGGVLLALAGLLVVRFSRAAPAIAPAEPDAEEAFVRELTPLERALVLLDRARERGGVPDQRRALENLAGELRQAGAADLAGSATVLAWAEAPPSPERTGALAAAVKRRIGDSQNGHHDA
jgi:hypothetical protein